MTLRTMGRAGVGLTLLFAAAAAAGGPQTKLLAMFHKFDPATRLQFLERVPDLGTHFAMAARGDVILTLNERGSIDSADAVNVVCRLQNSAKDKSAATIRWVVEDGMMVKKGDRLVELDDTALQDRLRAARAALEQSRATWKQGAAHVETVKKQHALEVELAQVDLRLAELEVKRDDGKDAGRRQALELKQERARLLVEKARVTAAAAVALAEAEAAVKTAAFEKEQARVRELHDELKECILVAPQDGIAVYPFDARNKGPVIAAGEPVAPGQILVRVVGLKRMVVNTRVPEAQIAKVRKGQAATVLIDAFPGMVLAGQVSAVATAAAQDEWLRKDVKVYAVQVALEGEQTRLRPSMSASVHIVVARAAGVVQVPRQALLGAGKNTFCYVKTAAGIEERAVTTGLVSDQSAEVTDGLKEGEAVMRDPPDLFEKMLKIPFGKKK